jgi:hypothetical protein
MKKISLLLFFTLYIFPSNESKQGNISRFLSIGIGSIQEEAMPRTIYSEKINQDILETFILGMLKNNSVLKNINQLLKTIIIFKLTNTPITNDFLKTCFFTLVYSLGKVLLLSVNIDFTKIIKERKITIEKISLSLTSFIKRLIKLEKNVDIKNFFYLMTNLIRLNKLKKTYKSEHTKINKIEKNIKEKAQTLKEKNLSDLFFSPIESTKAIIEYDKALGEKKEILKNKSKKTYFNELIEGPIGDNFFFNFIKEILEDLMNHYFDNKALNSSEENITRVALKFLKHIVKDLNENANDYVKQLLIALFTNKEFITNSPAISNNILALLGFDYTILSDEKKDLDLKKNQTFQDIFVTVNLLSEYFITRKKFSLTTEKEKNIQRKILNKLNRTKKEEEKIYTNRSLYLDIEELIEFGANKILETIAQAEINTGSENQKLIKKFLEKLIEETHEKIKKDFSLKEIENTEKAIQKALIEKSGNIDYKTAEEELAILKEKTESKENPLFSSIALAGIYTMATSWVSRTAGNKLSFLIEGLSQFGIKNFEEMDKENDILLTELSKIDNEEEELHEPEEPRRMIREA